MVFTDLFAGEIATELLKMLVSISRKSCRCKSSADNLITSIEELLPIIQEIKYSGVELSAIRQAQLDRLSETLREGLELGGKVLASARWNVYKNLQLARKMEKLEKKVAKFLNGPMQAHVLADVHHLRFEAAERFDRIDGSARRLEQRLESMKIGNGGWMEEAVKRVELAEETTLETLCGAGLDLGKKKVKEMVIGCENSSVVGILGIGGSGKTTLATELCRDDEIRSYFDERILFLTVSQTPNVEQLRAKIWGFISGNEAVDSGHLLFPQWITQFECKTGPRTLIVLDDVWSISVLEQLIFRMEGCKTIVVSRFRFSTGLDASYEVELLREDEAMALFCQTAFGKKSIPRAWNEALVKQIVEECKGLPLALKVIGASLRDQPEMYWVGAKKRLSRGERICESHETKLLERMAISVDYLPKKVRECFLDLGSFPEDKKIPLDILINMWVEIHDIDEEEAFAILVELSNKNLLTLVKDPRAGDIYSCYHDISATQHDVLRDLALHLSNQGNLNEQKRLIMPRRESGVPREWERNIDQPFKAQIVSMHTGEMKEMDWPRMDFPKAEVLILNCLSNEYFLPPFIDDMPKLRALIVINYGNSTATLLNFPVFTNLANLRSLWLEKVCVPQLSSTTAPLRNLRKISLVLCKIGDSFDPSMVDLPQIFPRLSELAFDHCEDLFELPSSICGINSLKSLSITNCHNLCNLPTELGKLRCLQILRLYACPALNTLPPGICELTCLKYLDVSQCVNLRCLPDEIGRLVSLEKIDMRECLQIWNLPPSVSSLRSLRHVFCDEDDISWLWKDVEKTKPELHVQVADKCYNIDWLKEY
ncbi:hypothetical protein SLEP1_g16821 [Rubroshorea leprosula]|uniref:RPW8 domain-containing protein n=1 Tax=Rubroshorea leprosula TaxID=152421 RepID=A0AAV5J2N8_9ROSI|nr:hypothetical protein SLEP1_g16821 [Rubroshorea leprosula]